MNCSLCQRPIEPGTKVVSIVGGMFPRETPDFFMIDETVLLERHAHLNCLLDAVAGRDEGQQPGG